MKLKNLHFATCYINCHFPTIFRFIYPTSKYMPTLHHQHRPQPSALPTNGYVDVASYYEEFAPTLCHPNKLCVQHAYSVAFSKTVKGTCSSLRNNKQELHHCFVEKEVLFLVFIGHLHVVLV